MEYRSLFFIQTAALIASAATTLAADWNQWRGPNRTGSGADNVALSKSWPQSDLPKLWESEEIIPGDVGFGFSSPVICGGNVYQFIAWKHCEPISCPTLSELALRDLGWAPEKLPDVISQKVEAARVSDERAKLKPEEVDAWITRWLPDNLAGDLPEKERADYVKLISPRLKRGKEAIGLPDLEKLVALMRNPPKTQKDFDQWFIDNKMSPEAKKVVLDQIPMTADTTSDTVICLSAVDGKTVWKTVLKKEPPTPLPPKSWGFSSTPCVMDGKVYVSGRDGVYCLDAKTGKEIWRNEVGGGSSSPCVINGVLVVQGINANIKQLRALNSSDGKEIWTQPKAGCENSSPVVWQDGGETFILCNDGQNLSCVSLKDGSILWSVTGSGPSSPVIADGYVVIEGEKAAQGLIAYKLARSTPEKAWAIKIINRGSSPAIYKGHVYAQGSDRTVCADLATGTIAWEQKVGAVDAFSSPSVVDGLMFMTSSQATTILNADPTDGKVLGKLKLPHLRCTSAAIADGKIVLRSKDRINCFDLVNVK